MQKESPNGGANWWVAGGEWVAAAYLGEGEKQQNRRKLPLASYFYRRRRGRGSGWAP
jgi:hypothetical protein